MDTKELMMHLEEIAKIPNKEWMNDLVDRKREESEFFDQGPEKPFATKGKFYTTVNKSIEYTENWIAKNTKGKVFLDYACGEGGNSIRAAKAGAKLSIGIDISNRAIQKAKEEAGKLGLKNIFFFQGDAENTHLPDNCMDTIICSSVLHHMDLSYVFPELRRILAPNGKILAIEALDYNFLIKLYRMLTPATRTEWEKHHIVSLKDITFAKRFFNIGEIRYWHITSYGGAFIPSMLPFFNMLDSVLTKIPLLRLMAWILTFELLSKKDSRADTF